MAAGGLPRRGAGRAAAHRRYGPEDAEEFFVYQYLIVAKPRVEARPRTIIEGGKSWRWRNPEKRVEAADALRIAFLGNFEQSWSTEGYAADALERIGHTVHRIHEYAVATADDVLERIEKSSADCLLFFKGRIGVDPGDVRAVLRPDPSRLVEVLRRSPVPGYLWYYDRVHNYEAEPSRLEWMRQVAPLCRVAFVTDGGLAETSWANWRVLRQGISAPTVAAADVPENDREDVAFLGQLYGARYDEVAPIMRQIKVSVISNVFGRQLTDVIRRHRVIIGPNYPSAPGYWSDRVYVVLGHGGFFLAPEVAGMREEGFVPGVHYAPLGDDPIRDIRHWLARPEERAGSRDRGRNWCWGGSPTKIGHGSCARPSRRRSASRDSASIRSAGVAALKPNGRQSDGAMGQEVDLRRLRVRPTGRDGKLRFRHRRKLGDIIYSLPVVRHLGGGILYLDPTSLDGTQDQAYWRLRFDDLIPFLEQQPFLHEVRIHEGEAFDVDLDAYLRTTHGTPGDRVTIAANHFIGLELEVPDAIAPWLIAGTSPASYPIIVHRSARYHGFVDYSFLFEVTDELYCVGSDEERRPFEAIGARPIVTRDVRELAAAINGCAVFIGNQSLPLALAAGLGKRRMIEESDRLPNTTFGVPDEFVLTGSTVENGTGLQKLLRRSGHRSVATSEAAVFAVS